LVKNQSTQFQNGIYLVTQQGTSSVSPFILTRRSDEDNSTNGIVKTGDATLVLSGVTHSNQAFVLTSSGSGASNSFVLGTDSLVYTQFTGASSILARQWIICFRKCVKYRNSIKH
jgi:hypothetical protein